MNKLIIDKVIQGYLQFIRGNSTRKELSSCQGKVIAEKLSEACLIMEGGPALYAKGPG